MSTAPARSQTLTHLTPKDLGRGWPETVSAALLNMVNNRDVRARLLDGNHVFLYAPDGKGTLKVSRSRPENDTLKYLGKFCDEHLPPVIRDDRPAKAAELAPLLKLNSKAARDAEAELAKAAEAHAQATWRPYMGHRGDTPTSFETNGKGVFRCIVSGCGEVIVPGSNPNGKRRLGAHASTHRFENQGRRKVNLSPQAVEMRAASGITWRDLPQTAGFDLTDSGVRLWFQRGELAEGYVPKLAKALGVTPGQLTGAEPWTPPAVIPKPRVGRPSKLTGPTPAEPPAKAPEAAQVAPEAPAKALALVEAPEAPEAAPTGSHAGFLARIASLAHQGLGEPDLSAELATAKAELGRTKAVLAQAQTELDEANAKLDLMRETLTVLESK